MEERAAGGERNVRANRGAPNAFADDGGGAEGEQPEHAQEIGDEALQDDASPPRIFEGHFVMVASVGER